MKIILSLFFLVFTNDLSSQSLITRFEQTEGRQTPTYDEIISWWKKADAQAAQLKMLTMGPSDAGYPLHLVLVSADNDFEPASIRRKKQADHSNQ